MRGDTWPLRIDFSSTVEKCDGAASISTPTKITSATASFNSTHLNQDIMLSDAGDGEDYNGTITAIDSTTQVTVCPAISTTVANKRLTFGQAIDITGNLLFFTLKVSNADADPGVLQEKVTAPVGAESTAGIGRIPVPSTKTILVGASSYNFDFQRVVPGSPPYVETPQYGMIEILEHTTASVA